MSRAQYNHPLIDQYLREAAGAVNFDGAINVKIGITEVISICVAKLNVSRSTVNRWRKDDKVSTTENALAILIAVNRGRGEGKKCNLKDIAILCNYKNMYRKVTNETLEINV